MTPLLLDSNLLSEKEARTRLSAGEAKYAHAKQHYQRPSSSASIYRPGTHISRFASRYSRVYVARASCRRPERRPSHSPPNFPVDYWDGDSDSRPMTMMAPGGNLPDKKASAYQPPPTSQRPPLAPFSSARPNTGTRSCRGFDHL